MSSMFPDDKPNIPLDEGWNDIIVKKALDPLVAQIEKGFTQKTKVFTNKVYSNLDENVRGGSKFDLITLYV